MMVDKTIAELLQEAGKQLGSVSASPMLDAELLLCEVLSCQRSLCYAHPEKLVSFREQKRYWLLIERRQSGCPVAYILGRKDFYDIELALNAATLVPRCDTECLVDWILQQLQEESIHTCCDLGTGSGAIAIALARHRPKWQMIATDNSIAAICQAQKNALLQHCEHIQFVCADWLSAFGPLKCDLIVSNPPYIAANDPHLNDMSLQHEPETALLSEDEGMSDLKKIIQSAKKKLNIKGCLVLEHGYQQGRQVRQCLQNEGYDNVATQCDLQGNQRFSVGFVGE